MEFVNKIEYEIVDFGILINAFKLISDYFEEKIDEDCSYLIKSDKDLYYELQSIKTLYFLLYKAISDIHSNCQNEIDLYYKELA